MAYRIGLPGGDTVIIISTTRQVKVHSLPLRGCSPLFNTLFHGPLPQLSPKGQKVGVRYLMVLQNHDEYSGELIAPQFRRIPLDIDGRPIRQFSKIHEGEDDHGLRTDIFSDFEKVIGSFYNIHVRLDSSSIATLLHDSIGLVGVAEYIGSVHMIAKTVDSALHDEGQALYQAIAADPIEWIDLAFRITSKNLFRESLIHLVGKYNTLIRQPPDAGFKQRHPCARSVLDQMRPEIRDIVDKKHGRLQAMCRHVDQSVATYYPDHLPKPSVYGRADTDRTGRHDYAKDVFPWMALGLYRHWVGQTVAAGKTRHAPDNGFAHYTALATGGATYLSREVVRDWHGIFNMSTKGQKCIENEIDIIKGSIIQMVRPLLVNESLLDTTVHPITWLTCLKVDKADFIWEKQETSTGQKRVAEVAFEEDEEEALEEVDDDGEEALEEGEEDEEA